MATGVFLFASASYFGDHKNDYTYDCYYEKYAKPHAGFEDIANDLATA